MNNQTKNTAEPGEPVVGGAFGLPPAAAIGSFVTPITVALTGMLYLAGWEEKRKLLSVFGYSNYAFEESIQSTLARGYWPLLLGVGLVLFLFLILWGIDRIFTGRRHPSSLVVKFNRWYSAFCIALGVLTCAYLSGNLSGLYRARHIAETIENGCRNNCFVYRVGEKAYLGVLLAQDSKRTALWSSDGLHVVATEAVAAVIPTSPVSSKIRREQVKWPFSLFSPE